MKKKYWIAVIAGLLAGNKILAAAIPPAPAELHVFPAGPSIEQARDEVRKLKAAAPAQDYTVLIHGGTYFLNKPLVFTPQDSAAVGHSITYKAADGEHPVFSSGAPVTGWSFCTNDPAHLATNAAGRLWVADIPKGAGRVTTLFDGQGRLPRAVGPRVKPSLSHTSALVADRKTLYFPAGSLRNYENLQDTELWMVPTFQWCHNLLPLQSIDIEKGVAVTVITGTYPLARRATGYDPSQFRICNVPDVLDEPGEWFCDTAAGKIWLWPRDGQAPQGVVVPVLDELLVLDGDEVARQPVRGLVFDGLTFKHAKREVWSDEDAGLQHDWERWNKANCLVRFQWTENCVFKNGLLTESGSGGIRMDLHAQSNRIENCEVSFLGATGIALIGDKIGEDFMNRRNAVHNNHVHHIALENHHCAGIFMWQSGENEITRNRVHHTPYNGFSIGGVEPMLFSKQWRESTSRELNRIINYSKLPFEEMRGRNDEDVTYTMVFPYVFTRDNLFAYNEIYRNMEILGDGNPFYIRMAGPGNVIRRNYFHDVYGGHSAGAMRFDAHQSDTSFEENIIYRCTGAGAVFFKSNRMINNIMVDILGNVMVAHGGRTNELNKAADIETTAGNFFWVNNMNQPSIGVPDYDQAEIRNNVLVQNAGTFAPPYKDTSSWPKLQTFFYKISGTDSNLLWSARNESGLRKWLSGVQAAGIDRNSLVADPLFVDAANQDFRFKPESPALKMGIQPVDRREAGLTTGFPDWLLKRVAQDADTPLKIGVLN